MSVQAPRIEPAPAGVLAIPHPGDIVLVHGVGPIKAAIRAAQKLRFRGPEHFWYWNHVLCCIGPDGSCVEAKEGAGIRRCNVTDYRDQEYAICHVGASAEAASRAIAYAESRVGKEYSYLTILSLLGFVLFKGRVTLAMNDASVCSTYGATFLMYIGMIWDTSADSKLPAHLAEAYDVRGPDAH